MRLKVYGVPKAVLLFFGLLPGISLFCFHSDNFIYRKVDAIVLIVGSLVLAVGFLFSFLVGNFRLRYLLALLLFSQLFYESISSVLERDFFRLALSIFFFGIAIASVIWIERRVASAHLNPRARWFEGDPLTDSKVETRVKLGESFQEARIRMIDEKGFFVFVQQKVDFKPLQTVSFELSFKGAKIVGEARLTSSFDGRNLGFGLQFSPKDLYHFTQYTALVQRLKGEGLSA